MTANGNILKFSSAANPKQGRRLLIPARLTEARLAERLTQTELASRVGVSRQAISSYELDDKCPEPNVLIEIASALRQPISFFTKAERHSFGGLSTNFFRKKGADTKRRNQACQVYADWLASSAYAFDKYANYPAVDLPSFEPDDSESHSYCFEEIEDRAEDVRRHFGLGLGPISNVVRLLETKGILVCRMEITGESVDAFSYWAGDKPFIFLASDKKSAVRRRFDAAHELAHLCLHKWVGPEELDDPVRLKQIESEADHFAGAFLLPRKSFPNEVYSPRVESFVDLKARWKVAIQAMIYRCKDLDLFDDRQVVNMYKQVSYKKWRTSEPLDSGPQSIPMEEPMLLRRVAELVLKSGNYPVDEFRSDVPFSDETLEQLLGITLSDFEARQPGNFVPTLK